MYKITVPVKNRYFKRSNPALAVENFKKMGVSRVLLTIGMYMTDENERRTALDELRENVKYLKSEGFEVGTWTLSFWYEGETDWRRMAFTSGNVSERFVCPSDENFKNFVGNYVKEVAATGVDVIFFDDDFRYGHLDAGIGCVCENHRAYMESLLGEPLPENFYDYLTSGGENKYRSALLEANRHFLLEFARNARKCVNEVAPDVRLALCSCMSVWDMDGATSIEISRELAGDTKPLLRLIGAPYWAVDRNCGCRLGDVVELERMELAWCRGIEHEIIAEGDAYPRPRYYCPASYLEGFDTAMHAVGKFDGILKYPFDYTSGMSYEHGYLDRHVENAELYRGIDEIFADKEAVGVRVYEAMCKYEKMDADRVAKSGSLNDTFFSYAARMLSTLSIPTTYEGVGVCGLAFGENARYLTDEEISSGLILDARAAEILSERGVDVGMKSISDFPKLSADKGLAPMTEEYFEDYCEYVPSCESENLHLFELCDGARVQSRIVNENAGYPASYIYENALGQRFFVLCFDGYFMPERYFRQYTRQRQIVDNVNWLSGGRMPAAAIGNPDLYVMAKSDGEAMSVGLWNFFADRISHPVVTLDREYTSIKFINCTGELSGNTVKLSRLEAFDFAGFEVK
ncbi:MAG: hypothetical protein IJW03_01275 [Clostridia bacterium]|nr:hypothetical protein [Clostridia bacterium]